jgi:hypothetical protein
MGGAWEVCSEVYRFNIASFLQQVLGLLACPVASLATVGAGIRCLHCSKQRTTSRCVA